MLFEGPHSVFRKNLTIDQRSAKAINAEKTKVWEAKLAEIERSADALGYKIDSGIKETVAVFNLLGLETDSSCEGHLDHGIPAPHIRIAASNEPKERFVGESGVWQKYAKKYGVSTEEIKKGYPFQAWSEAHRELEGREETSAYQQWRLATKKMSQKAEKFLGEFYTARNTPQNIRLTLAELEGGHAEIHNGGDDYRPVPENLPEAQRQELSRRLREYQNEMRAFTAFLKEKYFQVK